MIIREFREQDAKQCSNLVIRNFQTVLKEDYPEGAIKAMIEHNSPERIIARSKERQAIVAKEGKRCLGIITLDKTSIGSMFVEPDEHGKGVGTKLMNRVESMAIRGGIKKLTLESTPTAKKFYEKLGYRVVREYDRKIGGNKILAIAMEKRLI